MATHTMTTLPSDVNLLEKIFNDLSSMVPIIPIDNTRENEALLDILKADADAASFIEALEKHPRLLSILQDAGSGEYTLFVPLTSAWSNEESILTEEDLSMHISPHFVTAEGLMHFPNVPTVLVPAVLNRPQIIRAQFSSDGYTLINSARLVRGNVKSRNGIIHFIDKILFAPRDIVGTLKSDHECQLFLRAIGILNLTSPILQDGPKGRTLFVPNDSAFHTLGKEALNFLFNAEEGAPYLKALVKYHCVPGITMYKNLIWPKNNTGARQTSADGIKRIKGQQTQRMNTLLSNEANDSAALNVTITRYNGLIPLMVNGKANIVQQDVTASNGVIQVIDGILIPEFEGGVMELEELKTRLAAFF